MCLKMAIFEIASAVYEVSKETSTLYLPMHIIVTKKICIYEQLLYLKNQIFNSQVNWTAFTCACAINDIVPQAEVANGFLLTN